MNAVSFAGDDLFVWEEYARPFQELVDKKRVIHHGGGASD
jgi:hypothetical protein